MKFRAAVTFPCERKATGSFSCEQVVPVQASENRSSHSTEVDALSIISSACYLRGIWGCSPRTVLRKRQQDVAGPFPFQYSLTYLVTPVSNTIHG